MAGRKLTYLPVILAILFASCKKKVLDPGPPTIEIISVQPTTVAEYTDSISIVLKYKDPDGDLGMTDPDRNVLYIKDRRLANADYFFVKPLTPPGGNINVEGRINAVIKNTFILGTANQETTVFELKIRDIAGNWSNTAVTPEITITR